jgi:hypothetical protein
MAISFSKSISTTKLLNTYNNNVVEFTSDNALDATKCIITLGGYDFEITPINNVFRFNYKEVVSALINTNNFKDSILPDTNVLQTDSTLKYVADVTYTITFTDLSTEDRDLTYIFLKSVEQIAKVSNRLLANQYIFSQKNITLFNGYPFDVARYSNGNLNLSTSKKSQTITSTATNTERLFFLDYETNYKTRVIADGGTIEDNSCCISFLGNDFLNIGYNNVYLNGELFVFNLKNVSSGTYLKWFNIDKGSWNYWLFNPIYKENLKTKTLDAFSVDFDSIDDTYTTNLITAKEASKERILSAFSLFEYEMLQIESLFTSPRVELYNGNYGDGVTVESWQTVKVKDGTKEIKNTKRNLIDIKLTIEINQYTNA